MSNSPSLPAPCCDYVQDGDGDGGLTWTVGLGPRRYRLHGQRHRRTHKLPLLPTPQHPPPSAQPRCFSPASPAQADTMSNDTDLAREQDARAGGSGSSGWLYTIDTFGVGW